MVQPVKIDIATIHDVERTWFNDKDIKDVDIMNFAIGDSNKLRNIAP
jgi:hypothetical protein